MTTSHFPRTKDQRCRCPEAEYWRVGDVVMIGKGWFASIYVVVGRASATVAIVRYKREMKHAPR